MLTYTTTLPSGSTITTDQYGKSVNYTQVYETSPFNEPAYYLAPKCTEACSIPSASNKKVQNMNSMYIDSISSNADAIEAKRLRFLKDRVEETYYNKKMDARKAFAIDNNMGPTSFEDLMERLTAGKFRIDEDKKAKTSYDPMRYIVWRTKDADTAGFEAFKTELKKARQIAIDDVSVLPPVDGLAALRKFEAYTG